MKVSDILTKVPVIKSDIVCDEEVNGAFLDSRLVHRGSLFLHAAVKMQMGIYMLKQH